jgi:hypothetical protein
LNRLRASGKATDRDYRLEGVMEGSEVGVDHTADLLAFADAAVGGPADALAAARARLAAALGAPAMIDAAAVIAVFDGITRIADATGIPLEEQKAADSQPWRAALGIDAFAARKS